MVDRFVIPLKAQRVIEREHSFGPTERRTAVHFVAHIKEEEEESRSSKMSDAPVSFLFE